VNRAALVSGLVTTTTSSPVDVIKTRIMNDKTGMYKGPLDCLIRTVRAEGMRALCSFHFLQLDPCFRVADKDY
jgi:hypothetical protein